MQNITILQYHNITKSKYYNITILQYINIITLLQYSIITLGCNSNAPYHSIPISFFFQMLYFNLVYNYSKISASISVVLLSLDSLRSLQLASSSDLIFMSSTLFFSTLSCHRVEKKAPVIQTMANFSSSSDS